MYSSNVMGIQIVHYNDWLISKLKQGIFTNQSESDEHVTGCGLSWLCLVGLIMCEKSGWTTGSLFNDVDWCCTLLAGFVMSKSNQNSEDGGGVVMGRRTCYGIGGHLELLCPRWDQWRLLGRRWHWHSRERRPIGRWFSKNWQPAACQRWFSMNARFDNARV